MNELALPVDLNLLKCEAIENDYLNGKSTSEICQTHGIDENSLAIIIKECKLEERKYQKIQKENEGKKIEGKIIENLRQIKLQASERVLRKISKTLTQIDKIVDELAETGDPGALKQLRDLEQVSLLLIKQAEACGIRDLKPPQGGENNTLAIIDAKILQNVNQTTS